MRNSYTDAREEVVFFLACAMRGFEVETNDGVVYQITPLGACVEPSGEVIGREVRVVRNDTELGDVAQVFLVVATGVLLMFNQSGVFVRKSKASVSGLHVAA